MEPVRTWTSQELEAIGGAGEIEIIPLDLDGKARPGTTIWIVRHGDDLYVRSYRGADGGWYRAARRSGRARIRARGVEHDVDLAPHGGNRDLIDAAYRAKYGRSSSVDAMVTDAAADTTLQISGH
jgi:hypothetical protein